MLHVGNVIAVFRCNRRVLRLEVLISRLGKARGFSGETTIVILGRCWRVCNSPGMQREGRTAAAAVVIVIVAAVGPIANLVMSAGTSTSCLKIIDGVLPADGLMGYVKRYYEQTTWLLVASYLQAGRVQPK
jgi:hypothetical protein